jgi:hypothetical protein
MRYVTKPATVSVCLLLILTRVLQKLAQSLLAKNLAIRQNAEEASRVRSLKNELDNERDVNKGLLSRITALTAQLDSEKQKSQGTIILLTSVTNFFSVL